MNSEREREKFVAAGAYDSKWISDTWGWDTPEEFISSGGAHLRPRITYALRLAELRPGMRVLDVGCGRGEVVLYCARKGIEGIGVDYSPDVISLAMQAKARHTIVEQNRMSFICDDVKNVRGISFDRIFMLDLVEHLNDFQLDELLQTCRSILKPDGEIIIHTLPNVWVYEITYKRLLRPFFQKLPKDPRGEKERSIHINEMSIIHLHKLLGRNGFNDKIWLDDLITRQAKWHRKREISGRHGRIYRWMRNPLLANLYRALCLTPLRLLVANDIFTVAKHKGKSIPFRRPMRHNLSESFLLSLSESVGSLKT